MTAAFAFDCLACGSTLSFSPGQFDAWCRVCEAARPLPAKFPASVAFEPLPDEGPLTLGAAGGQPAQCGTCRAVLVAAEPLERCPYCASGLAAVSSEGTPIRAQGWLPPRLDAAAARKSLWTHCRALGLAPEVSSFTLVLVPWVSLRVETQAAYEGERGQRIHPEHGASYVEWEPVSGVVVHPPLDTGTLCSRGLPPRVARAVRSWDWPFVESDIDALPGPAETYAVDAQALLRFVVPDLDEVLDRLVHDDIGGDEQRVHALEVTHREPGIRLVWAPVWTGKLAHMDRVFAVNARSGDVVIETFEDASASDEDADFDDASFSPRARVYRLMAVVAVGVGLLIAAALSM